MEISRRPLAPGEIDHELIWLTVSIASLGLASLWMWVGLPWPTCVFHQLTGWPCLTCGATRSTIAFFHGDILAALRWNPLVLVFLCALSIFNIYAALTLLKRAPRLRVQLGSSTRNFLRVMFVAALAVNWMYLLHISARF